MSPVPVQSVVEYWVAVSVNVTPLGAAKTFTLPSVKVTVAMGLWARFPSQGEG